MEEASFLGRGSRHPVHLVVLLHGLYGSPANLWCLEEEIATAAAAAASDGSGLELVVLTPRCYEGSRTWDGIDTNAHRVEDVLYAEIDKLKANGKTVVAFSITGYSLGGLIARYLLGLIHAHDPHFLPNTATSFSTIATPHLGVLEYKTRTSALVHSLGRRLFSRTGQQIYLLDRDGEGEGEGEGETEGWDRSWLWRRRAKEGKPLLEVLADPNQIYHVALALFPKIRIIGNGCHDLTVPFPTAMITASDPFAGFEKRGLKIEVGEDGLVRSWSEGRESIGLSVERLREWDELDSKKEEGDDEDGINKTRVTESDGDLGEFEEEEVDSLLGSEDTRVSKNSEKNQQTPRQESHRGYRLESEPLLGNEEVGIGWTSPWSKAVDWLWPEQGFKSYSKGDRTENPGSVPSRGKRRGPSKVPVIQTTLPKRKQRGIEFLARQTPGLVVAGDMVRRRSQWVYIGWKKREKDKEDEREKRKRPTFPPLFILPYPTPFKYMLLPLVPIIFPIFFSILMVIFTIHTYQSVGRIKAHQSQRRLKLRTRSLSASPSETLSSFSNLSNTISTTLPPTVSTTLTKTVPKTVASTIVTVSNIVKSVSNTLKSTIPNISLPSSSSNNTPLLNPSRLTTSSSESFSNTASSDTPSFSRKSTEMLLAPSISTSASASTMPPSPTSTPMSIPNFPAQEYKRKAASKFDNSNITSIVNHDVDPKDTISPISPSPFPSFPMFTTSSWDDMTSPLALHTLTSTQLRIIDHFAPNFLPQLERMIAWFPYHFNTHATIIARGARPKDKMVQSKESLKEKGKGKNRGGVEGDGKVTDRFVAEGTMEQGGLTEEPVKSAKEPKMGIGSFGWQAAGRRVVRVWAQNVVRDGLDKMRQ